MQLTGQDRRFLFLQGPHGPFFSALARQLTAAGAACHRVAFNAGDAFFWRDSARLIRAEPAGAAWQAQCARLIGELAITDLVLYGDTRPIHADAIVLARRAGLIVHVFEEGYLRPYWATYERNGANGHSRLMSLDIAAMQAALPGGPGDLPHAPARWGDMRQHVFYGALYHWLVLIGRRRYAGFRPHRDISIPRESWLYTRKLLAMPWRWVVRMLAIGRIRLGAYPYHLALLQLDHDASFRAHSPFASMQAFVEVLIAGFAAGAPPHHHLILRAHPLEDGRGNLAAVVRRLAAEHQVSARVHLLSVGKLARVLAEARSAVTINSTAAQQALWRGLPVRIFGAAVYGKPELVSQQPLAAFFADPEPPDIDAYRNYRQFLLKTSQLSGGFYSARSRRRLLRQVVDTMLNSSDPYDLVLGIGAAERQHMRLVGGR